MRAAWDAWRRAGALVWEQLVRLIVINLLWLVSAWLIITVGPATLAAYAWIARAVRDSEQPMDYLDFFRIFRRLLGRGLLWSLGLAAFLFLAYTNLTVWGSMLPPLGGFAVRLVWVYALIFLGAMQPFLMEFLAVEELSWGESLRKSAWQVLANPIYSHLQLVIPIAGLAVATQFLTIFPVVMISLILTFLAVAATGAPWKHGQPPPTQRNIEDVL